MPGMIGHRSSFGIRQRELFIPHREIIIRHCDFLFVHHREIINFEHSSL